VTVNDVNDTSSTEKILIRALIISLLLHLLLFSTWRVGVAQGWWRNVAIPRWMQRVSKALLPVVPKKSPADIPAQTELTFVEVDPALAKPLPPKKPMFQGAQNTVAANREIKELSVMPNIDGSQEKFLKTIEDAKPKPKPVPVIPAQPQTAPVQNVPKPSPAAPAQPQTTPVQSAPKQSYAPGDLAMARPSDQPQEGKRDADASDQAQPQPQPAPTRPRTLAEAQAKNGIVGPPTHNVGGVRNVTTDVSLDVQGTPLGDYLGLMVETVRAHWYQLLETQSADINGKVILRFRLHPDGRISDMTVLKNEVSDLLQMTCQRAILDPKFPKWPREMRLDLPNDFYDITFTFYYEP
jgi:hypothetical protein